jgi:hypothetical protein
MPDENVHRMWSDDDLDTALAALRPDVDADGPALARARAELVRAAGGAGPAVAASPAPARRRRHWSVAVAVAAAVAVLVAGAVALRPGRGHDGPARPATTHEQHVVNRIGAVDEPLAPGRFRYVGTRAWALAQADKYAYLAEIVTQTWVPERERDKWLQRRTVTGNRKWIFGSEADAKKDGGLHMWTSGTWRAPCGAFGQETSFVACDAKGSWQEPSARFLASLPRDPGELYDLLRADTDEDYWILDHVTTVLRGGTVPADLRRALYRALAMSPHVRVTERVANASGRKGTAFSVVGDATRDELIVDPVTGLFIGERRTTTTAEMGIPKDTVIVDSAVTYGVVEHERVEPKPDH